MIQAKIANVLGNHIRSLSKGQDDTVWAKIVRKDNTPNGYDWQIRFGEKPQDHDSSWSIGWPISSETDMVWQFAGCLLAECLQEWGMWNEWSPYEIKVWKARSMGSMSERSIWAQLRWFNDDVKDVPIVTE
jgi:hypothetical protein